MQSERIVINYFYIDTDNAKPIIKAEPEEYSLKFSKECVIYKMSRSVLKHDIDNDEMKKNLNHAGIYFLLGRDRDTYKTNIYVGQAGLRKDGTALARRIKDHDNKKEAFWDEFVIFTTSDNTLEKSDICYLEDKFTKLVRKIPNNIVENLADTNDGNINDKKKNYFEHAYVQFILIVMDILGYKVFREEEKQNITIQENDLLANSKIINKSSVETNDDYRHFVSIQKEENNLTQNTNNQNNDEIIFLNFNRKNLYARCKRTNEGYWVLKGSKVNDKLTESASKLERIINSREKYKDKIDSNWQLKEDLFFKNASPAAEFVGGASLNGKVMWISDDGKTLEKIMKEKGWKK